MDGRTDGHLRPALLGRIGGVDLEILRHIAPENGPPQI